MKGSYISSGERLHALYGEGKFTGNSFIRQGLSTTTVVNEARRRYKTGIRYNVKHQANPTP